MHKRSPILITAVIGALVFFGTVILERCKPKEIKTAAVTNGSNEFVGDQACKSCHKNEYHDWLQSDHFLAMQPPNDSTVKGNFNNVSFTGDGITSHFFKKGAKFFINTEGDDGLNHDYEVKYTFGYKPLQQYLVEFPGGRMQVPRLSWDTKQNKWYNQYAGQKIPSHDWLHWTGNAQNWNTMCASCHSTNLQKNYNTDADSYHTTFSVLNVSCESCHGAGKLHVDYVNGNDYKSGNKIAGSYLALSNDTGQIAQINTCAPCHARKANLGATMIASNEILDNYIPEIPTTEHFYADGQVNDEDYIYTSFLESKMFRRGVKCSNCHNPHSTKLIMGGNQTCLQCHGKKYDEPTHTFHPAGIVASECISCHMPSKLYMGIDLRHDHSFRVPRPDLTVKYGTPNACTNCHNNRTAQWAADAVVKWFGPERKYHFAEDLIPGSKVDENSEAHLLKLLSDTTVPNIIKATAVNYLGSVPTQQSVQALINSLSSADAQIRYRALRGLADFQPAEWKSAVGPLLGDKVRAVRIAAADLYAAIRPDQIPPEYSQVYAGAKNELQDYLLYQADFSVGNVMIADNYLKQQDYANAEKYYLKGLKKDSLMNYARLNLSTVYNLLGKNENALQQLTTAAKIDPKNERIYYNLALLYNEMKNTPMAEKSFAKAVELKSPNPRVYYNYGLLLNQKNDFKDAVIVLQKGITISPSNADLYYALTIAYIQAREAVKAREAGIKLKQLDPNNPTYAPIFKNLGL